MLCTPPPNLPTKPHKRYAVRMILLHVLLAIASLGLATFNLFAPAQRRLTGAYVLAGSTLASGVLLIIVNHANVVRTCMTGIFFFATVTLLNEVARRRLATEPSRS